MGMSAPLNNSLLHSSSRIKQTPPRIINILHFLW